MGKITEQLVNCLSYQCGWTGKVGECESGEEGDLVCPKCRANCKVITGQKFYILSIKHTAGSDNVLSWWGPNRCGYVWSLDKAGQYTEQEIKEMMLDGQGSIAIPVETVEAICLKVVFCESGMLRKLNALEQWQNRGRR